MFFLAALVILPLIAGGVTGSIVSGPMGWLLLIFILWLCLIGNLISKRP